MDRVIPQLDALHFQLANGWLRRFYAASIVVVAPLALLHLIELSASVDATTLLPVLLGLLLGLLWADVVTGVVHWACDSWGDEQTPWLGSALIRAFREHHREPREILEHDWIEVNGEVAAAALVALGLLSVAPIHRFVAAAPLLYALMLGLIIGVGCANQLHQWAHAIHPPAIVRALQVLGLVLTPQRHDRHHRASHARAYCISTGWSNTALDALGFWRGLEAIVSRLTGAKPRIRRPGAAIRRPGAAIRRPPSAPKRKASLAPSSM